MFKEAPLSNDLLNVGQIYNVKKIYTLMKIKHKKPNSFIPQCLGKTQRFPGLFHIDII